MVAIWTAHFHTFIILCSHPEIRNNIKWNKKYENNIKSVLLWNHQVCVITYLRAITWARWRGVKRSTCTDNRSITGRGSIYIGQRESNKPPTGLPSCCLYHSLESAERNNWQGFCKSQLKIIGCLFTALYTAKSRLIVLQTYNQKHWANYLIRKKTRNPTILV